MSREKSRASPFSSLTSAWHTTKMGRLNNPPRPCASKRVAAQFRSRTTFYTDYIKNHPAYPPVPLGPPLYGQLSRQTVEDRRRVPFTNKNERRRSLGENNICQTSLTTLVVAIRVHFLWSSIQCESEVPTVPGPFDGPVVWSKYE